MAKRKEVGGLVFRQGVSYAGGIAMGVAITKYGISEDTLTSLLENTESILSVILLFIASALSYLQKKKKNEEIKVIEKKVKYND